MNLNQKFLDQILFVIVVYKKNPSNCRAFQSLCASLAPEALQCAISIYDNSPSHNSAVTSEDHKLFLHHNSANEGLSKSYNRAFKEAMALNKCWLFLLDQDTELPVNFFSIYNKAVQRFPEEILFAPIVKDAKGILSPVKFTWGRGKRITNEKIGVISFNNVRPINSGMMIRLDAFRRVNGFEESIKLDFSDFAFIEKIKKYYHHFVVVDLVVYQDFFDTFASKTDALHRFKFFHEGVLEMARIFGPRWIYYCRALFRMLQLTLRFKSLGFITIFFFRNNVAID